MKNYLLFAGDDGYNPSGGFDDFKGAFDTIEAAKVYAVSEFDIDGWWQVVDATDYTIKGTGGFKRVDGVVVAVEYEQ